RTQRHGSRGSERGTPDCEPLRRYRPCHQVARQVRRQVAERGTGDRIAAATALPGRAEEGGWVGGELGEKVVAVKLTALPLLKNTDPVEVAARGRERDGFAEPLDAAEE